MADNKRRFPWTVLIGDGLLLLCALMGLVGSFLSLYGDPGDRLEYCAGNEGLLLAYAALLGLATLAVWSMPRLWGWVAGGMAALWAGCMLWNWDEVVRGAGVTVRDITALFASRVEWGQTFSYMTGLPPAQEADSALLFLQLALAGLALLLGWAVVRSRRWWVVLALTLPPLLPGLLADFYPDWLSFMALAACWCAMLITALCRWAAADRRGVLTLVVLPAVALVLALITVFLPREDYIRPAWARAAENSLMSFTSRLPDLFSRWDGPFNTTVTYVGSAEEVDLAHAGPLNYTGRTVLQVTTDYDGWMYLRGSSFAVYEDGVWKALPSGTYAAYWSGQEPEVSPLYLPAMREQNGAPVYTVTVNNVGAVGACVYAPYFLLPQDVGESGMQPVEDAYLARRQGQWVHTMTFTDRSPQIDPWAYAPTPRDGGVENLTAAGGANRPVQSAASAYAGYVYDNYLDVPEDLRETLEIYAGLAPYPYRVDHPVLRAEAFSLYLATLCRYDAGAPAAPDGVDPVYYFLNESHRGYCMHYASAVTLMLRAAGIPARYVNGFAAEISPGRQIRIPDRAAHAWVEVWIDGFGWYPVEVTPTDAFAWVPETGEPADDTPEPTETPAPTETPEPTEPPEPTDAPDRPTETLPGSEDDLDGPGQGGSGPDFSVLFNVLKGAALVTGAVVLIWSVQFAVKRFRARRMAGADANRSALVCYGYLCRLERWGGKMDAQALELAQKARFSQHTLTREELSHLRDLVDRERGRLCETSFWPTRLIFLYWWGRPSKQEE